MRLKKTEEFKRFNDAKKILNQSKDNEEINKIEKELIIAGNMDFVQALKDNVHAI